MAPDREAALRGLLEATRDALNVPLATGALESQDELRAYRSRAAQVKGVLNGLIRGPLDNTAVQSAAGTMRGVPS